MIPEPMPSSYDAWRTQTPEEERGGDKECDMCERWTYNDEGEDGKVFCDDCLAEMAYENEEDV